MEYHRGAAGGGALRFEENLLLLKEGEQAYLDSRVQDLEKAGTRSRWIYGSALVVSLMLFSVAYNEYFSWYRDLSMRLEPDYDAKGWGDQLRGFMMKEWVASLQFDLPYVGGRFGASDAGVVGGLSLFLLSLWCFYAAKRENHVLYFLMKDAEDFGFSDAAKFYLRHQLAATQVFSVGNSKAYRLSSLKNKGLWANAYAVDEGEKDLNRNKNSIVRNIRLEFLPRIIDFLSSRVLKFFERIGFRRSQVISFYEFLIASPVFMAPFLSLLFVFYVDLRTLSEPSPFRKPPSEHHLSSIKRGQEEIQAVDAAFNRDKKLIQVVCRLENEPKPVIVAPVLDLPLYNVFECNDGGRLAERLKLSLCLGIIVTIIMLRAYAFQAGTQSMLRATRDWREKIIEKRKKDIAEEVALRIAFEKIKEDAAMAVSERFPSL